MRHIYILVIFICIQGINLFGQLAPRQWRDLLPYKRVEKVVRVKDKVYCSTKNSLFYYNVDDHTINTISKVQGLAESEIVNLAYSEIYDLLIIAYNSSNIDFIQHGRITNFPYLKNKTTISNKKISEIVVNGDFAYLSCGFGIVVLDLKKLQISDTYYPGGNGNSNNITDISIANNEVYANTEQGIFKGDVNDRFLVDYSRWHKLTNVPDSVTLTNIESDGERVYATYITKRTTGIRNILCLEGNEWKVLTHPDDPIVLNLNKSGGQIFLTGWWAVYALNKLNINKQPGAYYVPTYVAYDQDKTLWVADLEQTLVKATASSSERIETNSPKVIDAAQLAFSNGALWSVAGTKDQYWSEQYNPNGAQQFANNSWNLVNRDKYPEFNIIGDLVNIIIDPTNPNHCFMGSWSNGLIEYNEGVITKYTKENSAILQFTAAYWTDMFKVYGLSFDNDKNLWMSVSGCPKQLCVYTKDKKWYNYSLGKNAVSKELIGDVVATSWGHKWAVVVTAGTIMVFNDNNTLDITSDDELTEVSLAGISSLITSTKINCIVEDRDGSIWAGTNAGPVVFSNPQSAFEPDGITGSKIQVRVSKNDDKAAYVLETESINSITIDGANRKWIGTQNSGAYLLSADGTKEIQHFNIDNSPLFSNTINDIAIDHQTGEIFFATEKGILSYRGLATKGTEEFGDVYVYPNPIRENYTGDIIITNLLQDADVRITDVAGNLVFRTNALGGQAVWNGKNILGKRVNTGVYFVFCANADGSKTFVTKLLFIN